jgi:hypothetical protein
MKKRVSLLLSNANTTLKPLGKMLFYFYITLFFLGCAGIMYGLTLAIFKIIQIGSGAITPWWEITLLIIVSWYMTRVFIKESINLIGKESPQPQPNNIASPSISTMDHTTIRSNVIQFKKKIDPLLPTVES